MKAKHTSDVTAHEIATAVLAMVKVLSRAKLVLNEPAFRRARELADEFERDLALLSGNEA